MMTQLWKYEDLSRLRAGIIAGLSDEAIGRQIGRTTCAVLHKRNNMGLRSRAPKPPPRRHPPKETWIALVTDESSALGVDPVPVLAGVPGELLSRIRWRAWRRAQSLGFSVHGIGVVSGFDHTSVRYGISRLAQIEGRANT